MYARVDYVRIGSIIHYSYPGVTNDSSTPYNSVQHSKESKVQDTKRDEESRAHDIQPFLRVRTGTLIISEKDKSRKMTPGMATKTTHIFLRI